ncbi:MAG: outer membrane lipoprotein-sorting protein [Oligoflexia bacterium]|nr:outer membrane lipoprotein-sorting protein [Oligoflexia bacterium]
MLLRELCRVLLATSVLVVSLAGPAVAITPDETDPAAIMAAVEGRATADHQTARLQITIRDKAGRERTRTVQTRSMKFDQGNKQLLIFEAPADVRGAGLLSVDYSAADATDDQWLYLPSLGRSIRIASGDKSGSFMGTDLTYSDMTTKDPDAYTYTMVDANGDVDGEPCWVIEARPATDKEKAETGYLKTQLWVSKQKLMSLQIKAWVLSGKRLKYTKVTGLQQIDGVWIPQTVTVRTMRDGALESESILQFSDVKLNQADVVDADFTEQRLERGL